MTQVPRTGVLRFRSIFISDVHLGSRSCRADQLLEFLARADAEHVYLVGDIFDFMSLRRTFDWPTSHADVTRALLRTTALVELHDGRLELAEWSELVARTEQVLRADVAAA